MSALCSHSLLVPPIKAVGTCLTKAERMQRLDVKACALGFYLPDWRGSFQDIRRNEMERGGVSGRLAGAACCDWNGTMRFLVSFLGHKEIIISRLEPRKKSSLARFGNVSQSLRQILNRL